MKELLILALVALSPIISLAADSCSAAGVLPRELAASQPLFTELADVQKTNLAASDLRDRAGRDVNVRKALTVVLPKLIKQCTDRRWLNAVTLSGEFRIVESEPALVKALDRGEVGFGIITAMSEIDQDNDPVGKALSAIGDPALPDVAKLLESSVVKDRRRAVVILMNMKTEASRKVLSGHLKHERDEGVIMLIHYALRPS